MQASQPTCCATSAYTYYAAVEPNFALVLTTTVVIEAAPSPPQWPSGCACTRRYFGHHKGQPGK
eukprot:4624113-Karenia_brevis.AAC.1